MPLLTKITNQQLSQSLPNSGGRYIVRGGQTESFEGDVPSSRIVVIEFPNLSGAQSFLRSEEYRPVADIRHKNAVSRIMIVEGVIP